MMVCMSLGVVSGHSEILVSYVCYHHTTTSSSSNVIVALTPHNASHTEAQKI